MAKSSDWMISPSDFVKAIKREYKRIALLFLLFAIFGFFFALTHPLHYTAHGIFRSKNNSSSPVLPSSLFSLFSSYTQDDSKILIDSYPLFVQVVKNLDLQGCIAPQKKEKSRLVGLWDSLRVEGYNTALSNEHPKSLIFDPSLPLFSTPFIKEKEPLLAVIKISYDAETYSSLQVTFSDDNTFTLFDQTGKKVKEGHLDEPCLLDEKSSFTLVQRQKEPLANRSFFLSLIPLQEAALSLKKAVQFKPDKQKPTLIHITYTHSDRHLATSVVNNLMDSYALYLKEKGEEKIQNQLTYLNRRKEESLTTFESFMKEYQERLIANPCQEEGFNQNPTDLKLFPPKEVKFFATVESEATKKRDLLTSEIEKWGQEVVEKPFSLLTIREKIKEAKSEIEADLSLFKVTSADQVKELLKQKSDDSVTQGRLKFLLLHLLLMEHEKVQREIAQLKNSRAFYNQRTIADKRIAIENELVKSNLQYLGSTIEAKNIGFHLEIVESGPLEYAHLTFPDPPRLQLTALLLGFLSAFFYLIALFFKVVFLGPTASLYNLKAIGANVLGTCDEKSEKRVLNELLFHLTSHLEKSKVILLSSKKECSLFSSLLTLFPKNEWTHLTFAQEKNEELFNAEKFKENLKTLKEKNRWLFLTFVGEPKSLEMRSLLLHADEVIILIQEAQLSDCDDLPAKTLYLISPTMEKEKREMIPLRSLTPTIERLKDRLRAAFLASR